MDHQPEMQTAIDATGVRCVGGQVAKIRAGLFNQQDADTKAKYYQKARVPSAESSTETTKLATVAQYVESS